MQIPTPRILFLLGFLACIAMMGTALAYFQHHLQLEPCPLCIMQRVVVMSIAAVLLVAILHNPNSWGVWLFDHNKQTDFELLGAHRELHCSDCHDRPAEKGVSQSKQCNGCHRADDIHRGQFGSDCARCHTTESFRDVQIKR